jgi:hypothetical protein
MSKSKNYPKKWITIKPVHCHQRFSQNTLVSMIRPVSEDKVFAEIAFKFNPRELPFFFDHPIDHLPGMLTVNAMRQCTLALAHLLYDVPMDFIALLDWMNIKSFNYGELRAPTIAKSKLLKCTRNKHKITLILDGIMMQGDYPIMKATGRLIMLSPSLACKIRQKKTKSWNNNWSDK